MASNIATLRTATPAMISPHPDATVGGQYPDHETPAQTTRTHQREKWRNGAGSDAGNFFQKIASSLLPILTDRSILSTSHGIAKL
jgi:hypothetical protein